MTHRNRFTTAVAGTFALCAMAMTVFQVSARPVSDWQGIETAEVRLIQGHAGQAGMDEVAAGLEFVMAPGWKVYWRSPGDAGFPPIPNFAGSENLNGHRVEWPTPKRFTYYGLQTFGYEEKVVLPILFNRQNTDRPTAVKLELSYAACADICVPVTATLSMTIPAGKQALNRHGRAIARGLSKVPPRRKTPVQSVSSRFTPDAMLITVTATSPFQSPEVILEGPAAVAFGRPDCKPPPPGRLQISCIFPFQGRGRPAKTEISNYILTIAHGDGWAAETNFSAPASE